MPDIDIDLKVDFNPKTIFPEAIQASMIRKDELVNHPCGWYFQNISVDPITGLSAIPYKEAEVIGYTKFDFLHLSLLDSFNSKEEMNRLLKRNPNWNLLLKEECVEKLFHVHKHHALLKQVRPKTIQELADVIALIRPNKKHLLQQYIKDKTGIRPQLYRQEKDDKSSFKRGHAIAYALNIVLQLHLIEQQRL